MPSEELLTEMTAFNEELVKAGVMLAGEGLHPSSKGVRVAFSGKRAQGHRRPVRRDQGAARRATGSGRSSRSTRRSSGSSASRPRRGEEGDRRDPPGVRGRGLRRRAHARAARARGGACARRPRRALAACRERRATSTRTIDAVWRIESARLIAGLARIVRDVGLAEDLAQEALVAALEQWPESGVPDNPGAWLMATAKHRAIDRMRRADVHERKTAGARSRAGDRRGEADAATSPREIDDPFDDDLLRLIFTACHPVLSTEARVALTLRLLGGLTTKEIARAYLVLGGDVAAADRARQAHALGGARAVRGARARRAARAARLGARRRST